MNILNMIEQAIKLYGEASAVLEKAKPSLANISKGKSATLVEAQDRLQGAMNRAHDAHDALEEAISEQLAK